MKSVTNGIATMTAMLILVIFLLGWVTGFVIAHGFWSTLCCWFPGWAWYLVVERVLQTYHLLGF